MNKYINSTREKSCLKVELVELPLIKYHDKYFCMEIAVETSAIKTDFFFLTKEKQLMVFSSKQCDCYKSQRFEINLINVRDVFQ